MGGGKGVATNGFFFKKIEGGRATLHDNGNRKSCSRVWFTEVQTLLIRGKFEFITDHIALTWLLALRDPKEWLARWIMEMQTYDFDVL
jgi:RNase H-like domain found in reverse transcriptase